jgi:hypothetical protein
VKHKRRRVQGDVRVSRKKRALAAIDDREWVEEVSEAEAALNGAEEEEEPLFEGDEPGEDEREP